MITNSKVEIMKTPVPTFSKSKSKARLKKENHRAIAAPFIL